MGFDWWEYFKLAQDLVGPTGTAAGLEARQRSAISRAYYAAFCQSRNYLRDKEGHSVPSGGQVHAYVQEQFKDSSDALRNQIGHDLNRLRIDRNKADYNDSVQHLDRMCARDLMLAQRVLAALNDIA